MYQLSVHFFEMRSRAIYCGLSLVLTIITSYYYQFEILYIIGRPFLDLNHKFVLIDLTEAFYTILRISGIISFLIIIPFFIYHFWSFFIPSRYIFERKTINKFSILFFFLLFIELLILYFILFPKICEFLLSFDIISSNNPLTNVKQMDNPTDNLQNEKLFYINQISQELVVDLHKKNHAKVDSNFYYLKNITDDSPLKMENKIISSLKSFIDPPLINGVTPPCEAWRGPVSLDTVNPNKYGVLEQSIYETLPSIQGKAPVFLELTARLESYVTLSTRFYFIMLVLFQIPFIVIIFYYYNIIDYYILCRTRKFFIFTSILISAFISPPDIISQSSLAILLFFFYEFLIFIGIFYYKITLNAILDYS